VRNLRRTVPAALCAAAMTVVLCGCSSNNDDGGGEPASQPEAKAAPAAPADESSGLRLVSGSGPAVSPVQALPADAASLKPEPPSPAQVPDSAGTDADGPAALSSDAGGMSRPMRADMTVSAQMPKAGGDEKQDPQEDRQKNKSRQTDPPQSTRGSQDPTLSGTTAIQRGPRPAVEETGEAMIVCEPEVLDLGDIPTNDAGNGKVTLVNVGDEPRKIIDCKKSCGCTTLDCPKGKILQPGESVEVGIRLTSGTLARSLSKTVRIMVEKQAPIVLKVTAEAVSLVEADPEVLDPEKNPDGRIVLRATDGEPFTVKTAFPAAFGDELPSEPKVEQELYLDWDKWAELKHQRRLLFTLDHPKCRRVYVRIAPSAIPKNTPPTVTPPPTRNPTFDVLLGKCDAKKIAELVDEGEIKVGQVDRRGKTPLLKAAETPCVEVMQILLDASADIGAIDRVGRTPLMYAAQCKQCEDAKSVELLLDAGADVSKRDNLGNTALSWAAGFGNPHAVRTLIEAGSDVEVVSAMTGFTPVIWAALTGQPESIRLLIKAGADIEAADAIQGVTPLMHAVRTGGPESAKVLIEAGANLEAKDYQGNTPLLIAAESAGTDAETIRLLLDAGADITATDRAGRNALDIALNRADDRAAEIIELLKGVIAQTGEKAGEQASGK
jgi:ankyrin repeat protein